MEKVKQALYERLSNFWGKDEYLKQCIYDKEKEGAEELLDWCRDDYEKEKDNIELDKIWDICNQYLDLLNGQKTENWFLNMLENYQKILCKF